jgi:NAD(P)H-dependent FMN reductase
MATERLRLDDLPLFDPDLENPNAPELLPASVRRLRMQVAASHGLVIATPEYAHGVSSVVKTGLDWLVGEGACAGLPVALVNTSPRASTAQTHLREILATMGFAVVEDATLVLPLLGAPSPQSVMARQTTLAAIDASLRALREAAARRTALAET